MGFEQDVLPRMMQSALGRTRAFLNGEMKVKVLSSVPSTGAMDKLDLRDFTVIVGVGGSINMLLAFSFQRRLLDILTARFTEGIEIPEDQHDLYMRDSAAEIVNIITGHCTVDLQEPDLIISLTPPVLIDHARSIRKPKRAVFACLCLETEYGIADINFVGPRELFDTQLNYIETQA